MHAYFVGQGCRLGVVCQFFNLFIYIQVIVIKHIFIRIK